MENLARQYANALKLMYIFRHNKRRRGIMTRTTKAYTYILNKYGHKEWAEFGRKN